MARKRMVTRTIKATVAVVAGINTLTMEIEQNTLELTYLCNDEKKLLKLAQKQFNTDTYKVASIVEISTNDTLYGMPEEQFIALAEVLPDRNAVEDEE